VKYGPHIRLLRILLSLRVHGRVLPPVLQFVLIAVWHPLLVHCVEGLEWLSSGVQYGFSSTSVQAYVPKPWEYGWAELGDFLIFCFGLHASALCAESVLGWIGFRLLVRRPRARWRWFVRCWWRACLWAPLVLGWPVLIAVLLPLDTALAAAMYVVAVVSTLIYACAAPGVLARREVARRARRIGRFCPVCRYWLRAVNTDVCLECGTPLAHARHGGFKIDRRRPVPLIAATKIRWRYRRWLVAASAGWLLLGLAIGIPVQHLYDRLQQRRTFARDYFMTPYGLACGDRCPKCGTTRVTTAYGGTTYVVRGLRWRSCAHEWCPDLLTDSAWTLLPGDVLLVRRDSHYYAVKITATDGVGLGYEWYYQPNPQVSTFTDKNVEHGQDQLSGQIRFKGVCVNVFQGRIEYDYRYGGTTPGMPATTDPHYIAYAGQIDIATIDAADPGWVYKYWEDGHPYEYDTGPDRIDLRMSETDAEVLRFIWQYISPGLIPRDDVELAYLRDAMIRFEGLSGAEWVALRDDYLAGGRPGTSYLWDRLCAYRIADVNTERLGRVRGLIVGIFRGGTAVTPPFIAVETDGGYERQIAWSAVEVLHVGRSYDVLPDDDFGAPGVTCSPIRVRATTCQTVEGVVCSTESGQEPLTMWLLPFGRYGSLQPYGQQGIRLVSRRTEQSWVVEVYDWLSFTDVGLRVCPVCGRAAESMSWQVCPYDGSPYE